MLRRGIHSILIGCSGAVECWSGLFNNEACCRGPGGNPNCWQGAYTYEACCREFESVKLAEAIDFWAGDCWGGNFTQEVCCTLLAGPIGNVECWDSIHTFERCCPIPAGGAAFSGADLAESFEFAQYRLPSRNPHMLMQTDVEQMAVDFIAHIAWKAHGYGVPLRLLDIGGNSGKRYEQVIAGLTMYKSFDFTVRAPTGRPTTDHIVVGNVMKYNPSIADCSLDVVTAFEVLEHLVAPWLAAPEIIRWVRNLGFIVITVPFSWRYHAYPLDAFRFTHTGLRYLFESNGGVRTVYTGYSHYEAIHGGFSPDLTDALPDDNNQSCVRLIWIGQKVDGLEFYPETFDAGGGFEGSIAASMPESPRTRREPGACPKKYDGGCRNFIEKFFGDEGRYADRAYSLIECRNLCDRHGLCEGFFLGAATGHCLLARAGCIIDDNKDWAYYDLSTCHED